MTVGSAQAEIVVERLTPGREPAWTAFVAHHPEGHVYATLPFRDFLLATVGGEAEYLLARRGDEIVGVLPACARRSAPFGVVYNSLPWFGSYGGCLVSPETGSSARSALLTRWAELVAAEEVLSATLILPPAEAAEMATYVDRLGGAVIEPRRLQLTRLPETADPWPALLADFSAKSRNLARKAMRIGFEEVLTDEDWAWEFLFHTHRDNLTAMGGAAQAEGAPASPPCSSADLDAHPEHCAPAR